MDHIALSAPDFARLLTSVRVGEEVSVALGTPLVVADFRDAIGTEEGFSVQMVDVLPSCVPRILPRSVIAQPFFASRKGTPLRAKMSPACMMRRAGKTTKASPLVCPRPK